MSDEPQKDSEIEGHLKKRLANDEPAETGEGEDEVEAHLSRMPSMRMDSPSES